MTDDEAIAEIRLIASDMAIHRACPGDVSESLQYRVGDFLIRSSAPFDRWLKNRTYLTKAGTAILDGQEVPCRVHRAVVDDTAGELCRAIVQNLILTRWKLRPCSVLPECENWTPEIAEAAIREAAARLPELCDRLEQVTGGVPPVRPAKRAVSAAAADPFAEIETKLRTAGILNKPLALVRFCWARPSVTLSELSPAVWHDPPAVGTVKTNVTRANAAMVAAGIVRSLSLSGEVLRWN